MRIGLSIICCVFPLLLCSDPFYSWQSQHYIWNLGLALSCDIKPEGDPFVTDAREYIFPELLKDGDIIWIDGRQVSVFAEEILSKIHTKSILVISDVDQSFPNELLEQEKVKLLLQNENIIHIFAQNLDYRGPFESKLSQIPIGIDYHTVELRASAFNETTHSVYQQECELNMIISSLRPTRHRKIGALIDFHLMNSSNDGRFGESREQIVEELKKNKKLRRILHFINHKIPRRDLWKAKGKYAFSISPHGRGLDCHRTWEDLMLGCIVIVKTSVLDPLYEGLPVVIVKSWDELTPANFHKWFLQFSDASKNPEYREKLTHTYWMEKINFYKDLIRSIGSTDL